MSIEALTDSSLKRVIEYDRKRHTEYLYTLEIYLKNETSITRTSEELFIHRSSLIKRINKLKKLLQKIWKTRNCVFIIGYGFLFTESQRYHSC